MDDEPKTQSFRNSVTERIVDVAVVFHTETRQNVVFWSDILNAFPGAANLTIMNGNAAVPLARYMSYHDIEPKCIVYQPNATLTVILAELVDTAVIEPVNFDYAQSVIYSDVTSNAGPRGGRNRLDVVEEGAESVQDIEEVTIGMGRIEFEGGSSPFVYHQSSSSDPDHITTAIPANTSPFSDNHINGNGIDRIATPPLSTTSSSESGTGSGVSTSSATNIPLSNIDTAGSGASVASGTTVVPEPTEIDPVEATSSWASIFRTLGDLQQQYQLTPEETTKMFTDITQSA